MGARAFSFRRSNFSFLSQNSDSRHTIRVLYPLNSEVLLRCKYYNPWRRIRYSARLI
ncbi:hypothetical protein HanRHA438_Chr14g0652061 [Helianthus annuus]|nr:hypothetical protein HanRHA438_Chr14g0652061 [Helianthus annuus]